MAIARLHLKVGKTRNALAHASYIAREGRHANRLRHGEQLEASGHGNMPEWAEESPKTFWRASDEYERKNGTNYREMELALPRELTRGQRIELVEEWVRSEVGETHAYQWAIHVPKAADGGANPHCHLMFSERRNDGIERGPDQYFKRANAAQPGRGGCAKGYGARVGETLTRQERREDLKALRARWEAVCNLHLERAGAMARIDMRSYEERGIRRAPERKMLPSQWRGQGRADIIELRHARAEVRATREDLAREIPDMSVAIARATERSGAAKYESMPLAKLRTWIRSNRPGTAAAKLERNSQVQAARGHHRDASERVRELESQLGLARRIEAQAQQIEQDYRRKNPWRVRLHDTGVQAVKVVAQAQQDQADARRRIAVLQAKIEPARAEQNAAAGAVTTTLEALRPEAARAATADLHRYRGAAQVLRRREDVETLIERVDEITRSQQKGSAAAGSPALQALVERNAGAHRAGSGRVAQLRETLRAELGRDADRLKHLLQETGGREKGRER